MSSSGNSTSTVTANSGIGGSKVTSFAKGYGGIGIFTVVSISLFVAAFVKMSNFVGSKDDWNLIQPQIQIILILTLVGTFGLIIAALLYYVQDPNKTIYFILVVCCLSLGLSFSSLAVAAISR
jgi:hypothetical protein